MDLNFFLGLLLGVLIVCFLNNKQGYLNIVNADDKQDFLQTHFDNDCMELEYRMDENKKEYIQPSVLGELNCGFNTTELEKDSECMMRARDNQLNYGECANVGGVESCYGVTSHPTVSGWNALKGCGQCSNGTYVPETDMDKINALYGERGVVCPQTILGGK